MRITRVVLLASGLTFLAFNAQAFEVDAVVGVDVGYSTNPSQVDDGEQPQWITSPSASLAVTRNTENLVLESDYTANRRIFHDDIFDDEDAVTGTTRLDWGVVPNRVNLELLHFRTESTIDSVRNNTPANRQEVDRISGELSVDVPVSENQTITVLGRYSDQSFSETQNNSATETVEVSYQIGTSAARGWGVFASESETEFDDFSGADYDTTSFGIRSNSRTSNTSFEIEAAYTDLESGPFNEEFDGLSGSLAIMRGIGSPFRWGITASREFSDRSSELDRGTIDINRPIPLQDSGLVDVFKRTSYELMGAYESDSWQTTLRLSTEDDESNNSNRSTQAEVVDLEIVRRISRTVSLNFLGSAFQTEFEDLARDDDTISASLALEWQRSNALEITFRVLYEERNSDDPLSEFEELYTVIGFEYRLF